jgi:hypothetical protein
MMKSSIDILQYIRSITTKEDLSSVILPFGITIVFSTEIGCVVMDPYEDNCTNSCRHIHNLKGCIRIGGFEDQFLFFA